VIKLVAYQAENELARLIAPHYRRADLEGRTLVQTALASAADIKVTDSELALAAARAPTHRKTRSTPALLHASPGENGRSGWLLRNP